MSPDENRAHPATNEVGSESDHTACTTSSESTARAEVAAEFERAVLSGLLRCTAAEASPILAELDPGMFAAPTLRFGFQAVCAAVADGTDPSPVAAADAALTTGITRPAAWFSSAVTEMTLLAVMPTGPALPNLRWHVGRLAAYAAQRAAEHVLMSAWTGWPGPTI